MPIFLLTFGFTIFFFNEEHIELCVYYRLFVCAKAHHF